MTTETVAVAAYVFSNGRPLQAQIEEAPDLDRAGFAQYITDIAARFGQHPLAWVIMTKRMDRAQPIRSILETALEADGQKERHRVQVLLADPEHMIAHEFPHPQEGKPGRYGPEVGASGSAE